jgi:hypothetical protein
VRALVGLDELVGDAAQDAGDVGVGQQLGHAAAVPVESARVFISFLLAGLTGPILKGAGSPSGVPGPATRAGRRRP